MPDPLANDIPPRLAVLEEIARGTKEVLDRLDDKRLDDTDGRLDRMDARFDRLDARLDSSFGRLDARLDASFARMDSRINAQAASSHNDFRILVTLVFASNAALLGVMAHGFGWLQRTGCWYSGPATGSA